MMKPRVWFGLLGGCFIYQLAACGGGQSQVSAEQDAAPQGCTVGSEVYCVSQVCDEGAQTCMAGNPNALGPCVCTRAALSKVGSVDVYVDAIEAGAFGSGAFYWSEYHFVQLAAFSKISVSTPVGAHGTILIDSVPGRVSRIRATDSEIYIEANEVLAFTLAGEQIGPVDSAVAFPPTSTGQVTSTDQGLFVGTAQIGDHAWAYTETADGVYYIPYDLADVVRFVPFANPGAVRTVVLKYGPVFTNLWVNGTDLFVNTVLADGVTYEMDYADLSVVSN